MSLFYQHTINQTTKLGIWKIEEDENFFLQKVPLQQNITHPHKRLQHLAGRYLLQYLFPDFPYEEILIADTRKPYLPNEQYHFSISHCGNYAAAIVSSTHRVGIDIEIPTEKVTRIAHKFIHENEMQWMEQSIINYQLSIVNLQTILWSSKEAIFKWYSFGGIDFKENMQLNGIIQKQNYSLQLPFHFQKEKSIQLNITAKIFKQIVLSWIVNDF
ncbi:MAG TPA: 4'-phosphopantetheinyl transferase superfamily protein [Parafilimonas sp.]|nr:4'-phosphopantetheinyl transferase superfamily protein [Parafilimonas sp.]